MIRGMFSCVHKVEIFGSSNLNLAKTKRRGSDLNGIFLSAIHPFIWVIPAAFCRFLLRLLSCNDSRLITFPSRKFKHDSSPILWLWSQTALAWVSCADRKLTTKTFWHNSMTSRIWIQGINWLDNSIIVAAEYQRRSLTDSAVSKIFTLSICSSCSNLWFAMWKLIICCCRRGSVAKWNKVHV